MHEAARRWLLATSLVALAAAANPTAAQVLTASDLSYLGAFRVECPGEACSYNLNDLGSASDGQLWVTDHVYDYAVRRIDAPAAPVVSQVWGELPVAEKAI